MTARLAAVVLFALSATASAQAAPEPSAQGWLLLTGTGVFAEKFRWYAEVQPRTNFTARTLERLLVRGALGYQLGDKVSGWVGYGWTPLVQPVFLDEQRPFLQLLIEDAIASVKVLNRSRLEGRFIVGQPAVSLRARHMFRVVVPFGQSGFAAAAYDELFVNVNSLPALPMGLEQNRLFVGANYAVTKNVAVEAGYIWNHIWRPTVSRDRVNHVALLWLAVAI